MTYHEKLHNRNELDFGKNIIDDLDAVMTAAAWIDSNLKLLGIPKDWRDYVDPRVLDLADPFLCVIGQVGSYHDAAYNVQYAEDHGLLTPYVFSSEDIQPTWIEYFHAHRLATNA